MVSFEEQERVAAASVLKESRTLEVIQAEINALDPWGDDAEKLKQLEAEKIALVEIQAREEKARQEERMVTARLAEERAVEDEAEAAQLAKDIMEEKIGQRVNETRPELPSDAEIERLYMGTVSFYSDGRVSGYAENVRFSRGAMFKVLERNVENVGLVPPSMLKEENFRDLLKKQHETSRQQGNFETFYKLVSNPDYGLNQGEPKWEERTSKEITRMTQSAIELTEKAKKEKSGSDGAFNQSLIDALHTKERFEKV